jgi:hypothetical protein
MGGIGPVEHVVIAFPGNRFKGERGRGAGMLRRGVGRRGGPPPARAVAAGGRRPGMAGPAGLGRPAAPGPAAPEEFDTQKARILAT